MSWHDVDGGYPNGPAVIECDGCGSTWADPDADHHGGLATLIFDGEGWHFCSMRCLWWWAHLQDLDLF